MGDEMVRSISIVLMLFLLQCYNAVYGANKNSTRYIGSKKVKAAKSVVIQYGDGLVSIKSDSIPLRLFLKEFTKNTGVLIKWLDSSSDKTPISVTLKRAPLDVAIETIFKGFSYAYSNTTYGPQVIVLSSGKRVFDTRGKAVGEPKLSIQSDHNNTPESLEEYQPLITENDRMSTTANPEIQHDLLGVENGDALYNEKIMDRALSVLNSEHQHLYREGMEQLVGINDLQATDTLIDAAESDSDWLTREQAVELLWRHAQNLQYIDNASNNALRSLAEDHDQKIRRIAQQAILDKDNFMMQED